MTKNLTIEVTKNNMFLVKTLERFDGTVEWVPKLFETLESAEAYIHEVLWMAVTVEVTP